MNIKKCLSDQCLLMREDKNGTIIICVYIDDPMVVGDKTAIDVFKREISQFFATTEEGEMKEYVGCKVIKDNNRLSITVFD